MRLPATTRAPESALVAACRTAGLNPAGARLLHHYSNAIYHLPTPDAVARVTSGANALQRVRRTQAVTGWLTEHHFPATRPLPGTEPIPVGTDTVVSFWTYHRPPPEVGPLTSAHLAVLLRRLHRLDATALDLPRWVPLASLHATISNPLLSGTLADEEVSWLHQRITHLRDELADADWPLGIGLIHGDAWAGNLLPAPGTPPVDAVLGDWDWVSQGPREVDLIPTWHAAARYSKGPSWTQQFADRYGYDLADWDRYPTLLAMRDLVQLTGPLRRSADSPKHHAALRQRLDAIRAGDTTSQWTAL